MDTRVTPTSAGAGGASVEALGALPAAPSTAAPVIEAASAAGRRPSTWRSALLALLLLAAFSSAAYFGYQVFLDRAAQHHLALGKRAQFAAPPDLDLARASFERALVARPDLGEAHYYLGHLRLRSRQFGAARGHFAAALRDVEHLPGNLRADALRLLSELDSEGEPAALARPLESLALNIPSPAAAAASAASTLELPSEPTAAGQPSAARKAQSSADIVAAAALAERAALAAQRPEPSPDFLFAEATQNLAATARSVPASSDVQREVATRLDALYANDALVRLSAASSLSIAPGLNSDAVPIAVERAEAGLLLRRNTPAVAEATRLTLSLLQSSSPLTLALNRQAILRLTEAAAGLGPDTRQAATQLQQRLAAITSVPRPVVYIQIADEVQRPVAMQLATQLAEAGWLAPEFEVVGDRAPERTEVRSQGTSHQGLARWMRRLASQSTGVSADLSNLRRATPEGDVYEIWLDRGLCITPDRHMPGCPG